LSEWACASAARSAAHDRECDAPAERRAEPEADDRRERVAQVATHAVRRIRIAEVPRCHARVENREVAGMENAVADPHHGGKRKQESRIRRERRTHRGRREQSHARQQHRLRAEAIDQEPGRELGDAARDVERADDHPEQGPRHVELGAKQRKQRWQRELQKMGDGVCETDEPDHARVAPERRRRSGIQGSANPAVEIEKRTAEVRRRGVRLAL